ncbi:MAG: ABC transporter permease [Bacteroidales bacterium]|jgi:phospholipid/cholesterol/gamma-HCH transport system permease protein
MKKFTPVTTIVQTLRVTKANAIKLKEKTLQKTEPARNLLSEVADFFLFTSRVTKETFSRDFEFMEFMNQCSIIANRTLPLISVTGIIIGLVLTIQSRPVLVSFGSVSLLPAMVSISLIREMGPVITALICAGKIASGIGAELGSMKVTEQIDAMEVSSTNPIKYLIVTRVLATTLMIPLLVLYADALGIFGSWAGANIKGSVTFNLFVAQAFAHIGFIDFIPALIKTFFFGAIIGLVGCYKGYNAGRGTESVGIAANSAVVLSSLLVIIVDLVAVQITDLI